MIYAATKKDLPVLAKLGIILWKNHTLEELINEFSIVMKNKNAQFFLYIINDIPIGFAQCQLRYDYVEGTTSSPVGYLEGIFILEKYRHLGYGKELLNACEKWAKNKGCREFASDCELNNKDSLKFHLNVGFDEVNRIICFTKELK